MALKTGFGGLCALVVASLLLGCGQGPRSSLQIVAHQDDDLLFMNPSILEDIEAGTPTHTIYVTAGDAGRGTGYWTGRELGERAAYAAMAGVPDQWTEIPLAIDGRTITRFVLDGAPQVSLVFLRLPDGGGEDGYEVTGFQSLFKLWNEPAGYSMDSLDGANSFTRDELVSVLTGLLKHFNPRVLRVSDHTALYGDHTDHAHSGLFALEAHRRRPVRRMHTYRGYSVVEELENLSQDELVRSYDIVSIYAAFDVGFTAPPLPDSGIVAQWSSRDLPTGELRGVHGHLAAGLPAQDSCLEAAGVTAGSALTLAPCTEGPAQRFELRENGGIRGPGGLCVAPSVDPPVEDTPLVLAPCDDTPAQTFFLYANGQLRADQGLCVRPLPGPPKHGGCHLGSASWSLRTRPAYDAGSAADFSSLELGTNETLYRSLRLADVNGDGRADACARSSQGIECALALGDGSFAAKTVWTASFADADGGSDPSKGTTLQFADLDGDGAADVCGRDDAGVRCAKSVPGTQQFGPTSLWTGEFSDAAGGDAATIYSSLRLADLNRDGLADLCGHDPSGLRCLINAGGSSFGVGSLWLGTELALALDVPPDQLGRSAMLADIDGDGAADYCERGSLGVYCAVGDPSQSEFRDLSPRSQSEFGDGLGWADQPSRWRSIRLADVNGDGRADLCGRNADGLICGISADGRFAIASAGPFNGRHVLHVAPDFSDADGFAGEERGSAIQLGDVDGDGMADVCAPGPTSLRCGNFPL